MTRHASLAVFALVALALLLFALLAPPTKSDVPATATAVSQSEFVVVGSGGGLPVASGQTSTPSAAPFQPRTLTPAPSPAPAVLAPSARAAQRLASASRAYSPTGQFVTGTASWFRSPVGVSAAGPELRAALGPGWRGTVVTVTANGFSVRTQLGDWMRADRLIDLDAPIFVRVCGALSRGLCEVEVTRWPG